MFADPRNRDRGVRGEDQFPRAEGLHALPAVRRGLPHPGHHLHVLVQDGAQENQRQHQVGLSH